MTDSKPSQLKRTIDYLEEQIVWNQMAAHDEEKRQVNLRIASYELGLLDQLAEKYETTRTGVGQHLLQAAIHDACELAGIEHRIFYKRGDELVEDKRVGADD